ncbi:MAG: DUF393 domain-containing protein [Candidatus Dadabacteria bacterium]|nr:MAG: DUF393 domain-containing protein [Candidatus Dadabacteria bacterium]
MTTADDLVVFDGECGLCQRALHWIARHDHRDRFRFVACQDVKGLPPDAPDPETTVLLIRNGRIYSRSAAAWRIAAKLRFPACLVAAIAIIPAPLRDAVYRWVARHRRRWFPPVCDWTDVAEVQRRLLSSATLPASSG